MKTKNINREEIITFVNKNYNIKEEYLWKKYPRYCVFRNMKNRKWFGIIMNINAKKIGLDNDEEIDILVVKCESTLKDILLDKRGFLPAYHMNKNNWITILLNGSCKINEIEKLIKHAYELVDYR